MNRITRNLTLLAAIWLMLVAGCARMPGVTSLRPANFAELQSYLLSHAPDLDQFRLRGPFTVEVRKDQVMQLSATERVVADLYLSSPAEPAPLVILLHGHDNSKENHAYQGIHLATWGMHSLVLQLPNQGPWVANGRTLAKVVDFIRRRPEILSSRIDVNRIVVAGHSYGASAVTVALAERAPATGGVLLDPAGTGREMVKFLRQVNKPVMVIGSDDHVTRVRDRGLFYELIRSGVADVSISGAHHEDGEFPLEAGDDSSATLEHQITFVSALTSAAFSLALTGKLDYVWTSLRPALQNGTLFDALKK